MINIIVNELNLRREEPQVFLDIWVNEFDSPYVISQQTDMVNALRKIWSNGGHIN